MYDLSLNILTHWNNIPFVGLQAFARWGVDRASSSDARVQGSNPSHSISKITTFLPKTRWLFGAKCVEPMGLHILGVIPGSDTIKGLGTGYTYRLLRLTRCRLPPQDFCQCSQAIRLSKHKKFFFYFWEKPDWNFIGKGEAFHGLLFGWFFTNYFNYHGEPFWCRLIRSQHYEIRCTQLYFKKQTLCPKHCFINWSIMK